MPYGRKPVKYDVYPTPELKKEFRKFKLKCPFRKEPDYKTKRKVFHCESKIRGTHNPCTMTCAFFICPEFQTRALYLNDRRREWKEYLEKESNGNLRRIKRQ